MVGVRKRLHELRDALSQVSVNDRFLSKTRIPAAVWVEILGRAAWLFSALGRTSSASISAACHEHLLQVQHSTAATAALKELASPSGPAELQVKRLRLVKDWLSHWLTKDRKTGVLKPMQNRDELRKEIVSWNTANRLMRGQAGFLTKRGSSDDLLHKLAEAAVNKQLATQDTIAAQERMSSCPGLPTNEVPPAGIPPSEWSSATYFVRQGDPPCRGCYAAAMRGSLAVPLLRTGFAKQLS
jgi:hypothetical protein